MSSPCFHNRVIYNKHVLHSETLNRVLIMEFLDVHHTDRPLFHSVTERTMNLYSRTNKSYIKLGYVNLTSDSLGCNAPPFSSCPLIKFITFWNVYRLFTATFPTFSLPALPTAFREISILSTMEELVNWINVYTIIFVDEICISLLFGLYHFKLIIEIINLAGLIIFAKVEVVMFSD